MHSRKKRMFGYQLDHTHLNQKEARLLREAKDAILNNTDTLSGICRKWNGRGIRTTLGNEWAYQALRWALLSPTKAGLVPHEGGVIYDRDGNLVCGQWEPLWDVETYERLVRKLSEPGRRTNHVQGEGRKYLLTGGLAACGACGEPLRARPRKGRRSYGCSGSGGCAVTQVAEPLEDFVRDVVIEAVSSGHLNRSLGKARGEEERERKLLAELDAVNRTLEELDDAHYDGSLPKDRYLRQKTRQEARRDKLTAQLSSNGRGRVLAGLPRGAEALRTAWERNSLKWRRSVVGAVMERVVVSPDPRRGRNAFDPERLTIRWR
jgi:hypothetical protein